jgi:hypothetical protein
MALAVSTSCGDSAKNKSGSLTHGKADLVRATGTMAPFAPEEVICRGTAPGAP